MIIDDDLAMGAHSITLSATQTVDGKDLSDYDETRVEKETADVEQLTKDTFVYDISDTISRTAFKYTPSEEYIESVTINLKHAGISLSHTPMYLRLRKVSNDAILAEKLFAYRDDEASETQLDYVITFDDPVFINEEIYVSMESAGGAADDAIKQYGKATGDNSYFFTDVWSVGGTKGMYHIIALKKQYKVVKI